MPAGNVIQIIEKENDVPTISNL